VVAGHLPCVKLLLDNSAKAYSHNSMGETPRDCIPFDRASTEYKDMVSALGPPPPPRASSSSSSNRHAKRTGPHRMDGAAAGSNNDSRSATAAKFAEIAGARK
jgi:ankyrin repeat protein